MTPEEQELIDSTDRGYGVWLEAQGRPELTLEARAAIGEMMLERWPRLRALLPSSKETGEDHE